MPGATNVTFLRHCAPPPPAAKLHVGTVGRGGPPISVVPQKGLGPQGLKSVNSYSSTTYYVGRLGYNPGQEAHSQLTQVQGADGHQTRNSQWVETPGGPRQASSKSWPQQG